MKLILFISSFLFLSGNIVFAQSEDTNKRIGFGGFTLVNSTLAGDWMIESGGLGGAFISKNIYIGGGGFGLNQKTDTYKYDMGYGGLMLGYFWQGVDQTSLHFYILGGYGAIEEKGDLFDRKIDDIWAIRPAIEVDFLIKDWLRLGIGGGYRGVTRANLSSLDNSDLSAPFSSITFRFGNWGR